MGAALLKDGGWSVTNGGPDRPPEWAARLGYDPLVGLGLLYDGTWPVTKRDLGLGAVTLYPAGDLETAYAEMGDGRSQKGDWASLGAFLPANAKGPSGSPDDPCGTPRPASGPWVYILLRGVRITHSLPTRRQTSPSSTVQPVHPSGYGHAGVSPLPRVSAQTAPSGVLK